jgi:Peptidase inhibitor family I36
MSDRYRNVSVRDCWERSSAGEVRLGSWGCAVKILTLAIAFVAGLTVVGTPAPWSREEQPSPLLARLGMVGSTARPPPDCASNRVCLYEDFVFRGPVVLSSDTLDLESANDQASSVFNNSPHVIFLYEDSGYGGPKICLNPNTGIDNLALFGQNDSISSIEVSSVKGCG